VDGISLTRRPSAAGRLLKTIRFALSDLLFLDYLFDWRFGTDTVTRVQKYALDIDSRNRHLGSGYQGTRALALSRFLKSMQLGSDRVLLDLGSGKGKVLLVAAQCGLREVHGVEWSAMLCSVASRNIAAFRRKTGSSTVFKVFHSDAVDYPIEDREDVFYLYRPFEDPVLAQVIRNIESSVRSCPRKIWIVCNDMPESAGRIVTNSPLIAREMVFKYLRWTVRVYTNEP
jgi:SAM-dependent methyltransferase